MKRLYYPQGESIDWTYIESVVLKDYASKMKGTPVTISGSQKTIDAWTLTVGVCETLVHLPSYKALPERKQKELFLAALLMSIAQDQKSRRRRACHDVRSFLCREYGLAGSAEALWLRETVCSLVSHRHLPLAIVDSPGEEQHFRFVAAEADLNTDYNWELQCVLAEAMIRSMDSEYIHRELPTLDYCRERAKQLGCYTSPYQYRDAHTRFMSFYWYPQIEESRIVDDTWGEAIIVCGLPGTDREAYILKNYLHLPVIHLSGDEEEMVPDKLETQEMMESGEMKRLMACLAVHQPCVVTGDFVSSLSRSGIVGICHNQKAMIRIVWLESSWEETIKHAPDRSALEYLLLKVDLPHLFEADNVEWKWI